MTRPRLNTAIKSAIDSPAKAVMMPLLALLVLIASPAFAQSDPRIERDTGRDLRVWNPPRHFDHRHLRLEIDFPNPAEPRMLVRQRLTMAAIGRDRDLIELDAGPLNINSLRVDGTERGFSHAQRRLSIPLRPPAPRDREITLEIDYELDLRRTAIAIGGLLWNPGEPGSTQQGRRHPRVHTQGQPQFNHNWFACRDRPDEKITSEIIVVVPEEFRVLSNGRLLSRNKDWGDPAGEGRRRWHWLQDKPHSPYLVTLVIGMMDVVEVEGLDDYGITVPMRLWGIEGSAERLQRVFASTPAMFDFFQREYGVEYPWDKYDQVIAPDYIGGAMENTTASTFASGFLDSPAGGADRIIAHELAHQWIGNLVTCRTWEHIWLNEGYASMAEALWAAESVRLKGGSEADADGAYLEMVAGALRGQGANRPRAPREPAMASNFYYDPIQIFAKRDNPYQKGLLVLHMLRERLGPDLFRKATTLFIERHAFDTAESNDLRRAMEEVSGLSLEKFFDQWVFRHGLPELRIDLDWNADTNTLTIRSEQIQPIDEHNPAFVFDMPVTIFAADDSVLVQRVKIDGQVSEATFELSATPVDVMIDPRMTVTCRKRVRTPLPGARRTEARELLAEALAAGGVR